MTNSKEIMSKEQKIAKEKSSLLDHLAANNLNSIRSKVAYILNHYPKTRNSDILLCYKYWEVFHSELYNNGNISQDAAFKIERQPSIIRARAKIQNTYGLFQADDGVKRKRFSLDDKEREAQVADRPEIPSIVYYIDESSKNEDSIVVGGLCFLEGRRMYEITRKLYEWKANNNIKYEFHFTRLTKQKLSAYKSFFLESLSHSDSFSLKAIATKRAGIIINDAICEMHYQLVHQGTQHDIETGRITLPREVLIYKDKEDDSSDALISTKIRQELETGFKKHFDKQLNLQLLESINSEQNPLMQLTDIFIGCIARNLNFKDKASYNQKDELADFVLNTLNIDPNNSNPHKSDVVFFNYI